MTPEFSWEKDKMLIVFLVANEVRAGLHECVQIT